MTGTHHVEIKNRDAVFKFDLHRNITFVRGDSGTGKTTLFDMVSDYTRLKAASGISGYRLFRVICPCGLFMSLDSPPCFEK